MADLRTTRVTTLVASMSFVWPLLAEGGEPSVVDTSGVIEEVVVTGTWIPGTPEDQFTVIVDGIDLQSDAGANALFMAGCDDATAARINGVQYVDFDRDAGTLDEAIQSALSDLRCLDGVEVVRILNPTASSRVPG